MTTNLEFGGSSERRAAIPAGGLTIASHLPAGSLVTFWTAYAGMEETRAKDSDPRPGRKPRIA